MKPVRGTCQALDAMCWREATAHCSPPAIARSDAQLGPPLFQDHSDAKWTREQHLSAVYRDLHAKRQPSHTPS